MIEGGREAALVVYAGAPRAACAFAARCAPATPMSVICATDFGREARRAADAAAALAFRFGEPLVLVTAVAPPAALRETLRAEQVDRDRELESEAMAALAGERERIAASWGELPRARMGFGRAEPVIARAVARHAGRLVVTGSTPRGAPARWIRTSTAERIARAVRVPVLGVRAEPRGLCAWAADQRPLRILVALETDETFLAALDAVEALVDAGRCEVRFVHVRVPGSSLEAALHRLAADEPAVSIVRGPPASAIAREAREHGADLVVAGMHRRGVVAAGLRKATAAKVLRLAGVPVLFAPRGTRLRREAPQEEVR